jgi:hypothetical protein
VALKPLDGSQEKNVKHQMVITMLRKMCSSLTMFPNIFSIERRTFAIFFPEDVHAPMIGEGTIKKLVIKVKI